MALFAEASDARPQISSDRHYYGPMPRLMNQEMSSPPDLDSALKELKEVYRELEDELARLRPHCNACGTCCNLRLGGYVLYASELETELVTRSAGRSGPLTLTPEGECPFLTEAGRCGIHPHRPLGCRTHFCDTDYRPNEADVYQAFIRRIADISDRHNLPWNYRPFHSNSRPEATGQTD